MGGNGIKITGKYKKNGELLYLQIVNFERIYRIIDEGYSLDNLHSGFRNLCGKFFKLYDLIK
jgi:hypothetical protein